MSNFKLNDIQKLLNSKSSLIKDKMPREGHRVLLLTKYMKKTEKLIRVGLAV